MATRSSGSKLIKPILLLQPSNLTNLVLLMSYLNNLKFIIQKKKIQFSLCARVQGSCIDCHKTKSCLFKFLLPAIICHKECKRTFMIHRSIKFYMSSSNNSLLIAIKLKAKYIFHPAIILLFLQKKKSSKKFHHFLTSTLHTKPWPYIKSHSLFTSS